jgi:hypothetical protein|tara:strand:+ start:88 stop:603 length:516 start_codon:yes stop_codon:yes gene_type:complete
MKKKKTTVLPKSIRQSLEDAYQSNLKEENFLAPKRFDPKGGIPVKDSKVRKKRAYNRTIKENPKAVARINKKAQQNKNVGGFLETFSPAYSIAKGKGPIGEAVRGGKGMGILGMLASQADKGKKKAGSDAMKADAMVGADRMSGGGKVVKSKRTRSIDGIATRGKTRGTQR